MWHAKLLRCTLCLSSTYAEDPHLCSLPPGCSARGDSLSVTLQTGRTLVKHILVSHTLWGLSAGPDTPQCPPESHKTGSVLFASSETDRQWDTWKSWEMWLGKRMDDHLWQGVLQELWMALPGKHPLEDGKYLLLEGPCRKPLSEVGLNGGNLGHCETPNFLQGSSWHRK